MTGKGTKKFRFPVAVHLDKAVGALTLHTGVGTYIISTDRHKKCQRQSWRTHVALSKCTALQIWGFFSRKAIESTKKASDKIRCLKIRDRIITPLYRIPYLLSELSSALGLGSIVSTKSTNSELESGVIISLKRFFISKEESPTLFIKFI